MVIKEECANCDCGQHVQRTNDLQTIRYCRRYPANLPIPTPQGVVFVQPNVSDQGWCAEWRLKRDEVQ